MGEIVLYLGGAKSGKTKAALAHAEGFPPPRFYLATAQSLDGEMASRIRCHQAERGKDWRTIEEPLDPAGAMARAMPEAPVLVDCLTLWLSNLLAIGQGEDRTGPIVARVEALVQAAMARPGPVIIVSNEVGGGLVPMEALGRLFRDLSGLAHQLIAREAGQVFLVTAGLAQRLK
ncbi:MAG: bifunctional adenosylcobinamide kinase/adenosylcobinamide-phosphate guanylyltransferase [Deltaproteobacteria bacterium]|jgi:adenosylcobinamide kinase/adenosylcobinamide-phosphate guanylyltransferase|nr:bifunctional adenosylcobinamide kinase/adenosylcobinamide-phosphate guanylyltransferase [Deltaproteobacteria bacterium]